jgi:hypothetical protein
VDNPKRLQALAPLDPVEPQDLTHDGRNALEELQSGIELLRLTMPCHPETAEILEAMAAACRRLKRVLQRLERLFE